MKLTHATRVPMRLAGVQVVTGGLGGLGLRAAALLVACGASQVVISSRSGRVAKDGAARQWCLPLFKSLVCVVQASDVADAAESSLGRVCNQLLHAAGTLASGAVVSIPCGYLALPFACAGALRDGLIRSMAMKDIEAVFGPKALAASRLRAATASMPLACSTFSSWISVLGSIGVHLTSYLLRRTVAYILGPNRGLPMLQTVLMLVLAR